MNINCNINTDYIFAIQFKFSFVFANNGMKFQYLRHPLYFCFVEFIMGFTLVESVSSNQVCYDSCCDLCCRFRYGFCRRVNLRAGSALAWLPKCAQECAVVFIVYFSKDLQINFSVPSKVEYDNYPMEMRAVISPNIQFNNEITIHIFQWYQFRKTFWLCKI